MKRTCETCRYFVQQGKAQPGQLGHHAECFFNPPTAQPVNLGPGLDQSPQIGTLALRPPVSPDDPGCSNHDPVVKMVD